MDYIALRDGMAAAVPFNGHLGLEILELGPGMARVLLHGRGALEPRMWRVKANGLSRSQQGRRNRMRKVSRCHRGPLHVAAGLWCLHGWLKRIAALSSLRRWCERVSLWLR